MKVMTRADYEIFAAAASGEAHLNRYLGEFDFRYNNRHVTDIEQTKGALRGIEGKRLLYCHS